MHGIRRLLKKESGICPICVLPYVREKRTLRAEYFDQAYDLTVWTLRCPECGYEVILPGFARIHTRKDIWNATCADGAVQPSSGVMILPPPTIPEARMEDAGTLSDRAPEPVGAPVSAEKPENPGKPGNPGSAEAAKLSGNAETPEDTRTIQTAESAKNTAIPETQERIPTTTPVTHAGFTEPDRAPIPHEPAREKKKEPTTVQTIQNVQDDPGLPVPDIQLEQKPQPVQRPEDTKAESMETGRTKKEKSVNGQKPAGSAKAAETAKTPEAVEKVKKNPPPKPEREAGLGQNREQGGRKTQNDEQIKGKSKERNTRDSQPSGVKNPAGEQAGQDPPPRREHTGGQNKTAPAGDKRHPASGVSPQSPAEDRKTGVFPGSIQSRFSGNGMFRPSTLGTLDALRASVHDDAAKRQKSVPDAAQDRNTGQADTARNQTEAARKEKPEKNSREEGQQAAGDDKRKPAGSGNTDHQRAGIGAFADKQNTAQTSVENIRQILEQKKLSAENPAKQGQKELSAEKPVNSEGVSGKAPVPANERFVQVEKQPDAHEAPENTTNTHKPNEEEKPVKQGETLKPDKADQPTGSVKDTDPAEKGKVPDGMGTGGKKEPDTGAGASDKEDSATGKAGRPSPGGVKDGKDPEDQEGQGHQENAGDQEDTGGHPEESIQKEQKKHDAGIASKLQEKLPADLVEKLPVISQISKQQKHALFVSEEKRFLEQHIPHKQVIVNDLIYDTDTSEMFLRLDGRYGLDNPCVHYNYRTKNGNFFRCTVKYKHEDSIRPLDLIEAKRMLEEYPELYKRFFPDSVSDA